MMWARIACKMSTSATIQRIADRTSVRRNEAQGAVVNVLLACVTHAADGNLSHVPDRSLEQWADWEGKRGAFATAFRAEMCTPDGVITRWESINGKALRKAERDRERKRAAADAAVDPDDYSLTDDEEPARKLRGNSAEIPRRKWVNGTERNGSTTPPDDLEKRCSTPRELESVLPRVLERAVSRHRRGAA